MPVDDVDMDELSKAEYARRPAPWLRPGSAPVVEVADNVEVPRARKGSGGAIALVAIAGVGALIGAVVKRRRKR